MKKFILLTGPQGSGNHLFSKIFAGHPQVTGWSALLKEFWIPHEKEPFADCWQNTELLEEKLKNDIVVCDVSCPYVYKGHHEIPAYKKFLDKVESLGYSVHIFIIGRDRTILINQQQRIRKEITINYFFSQIDVLTAYKHNFLNTELLFLYGQTYIDNVFDQVGLKKFTVDINLYSDDTNYKYIKQSNETNLDRFMKNNKCIAASV
jgi:hypothetical protein